MTEQTPPTDPTSYYQGVDAEQTRIIGILEEQFRKAAWFPIEAVIRRIKGITK